MFKKVKLTAANWFVMIIAAIMLFLIAQGLITGDGTHVGGCTKSQVIVTTDSTSATIADTLK